MLQPGQTLGIIGGGQLGRMLAREARIGGFKVVVFTDEYPPSPAGQVADREINAPYFNPEAVSDFVSAVDVVTMEFENIPGEFIEAVEQRRPVFPSRLALHICQNREREKGFLREHGIPHARFRVVDDPISLKGAVDDLGGACMLKTAAFGYDGKGQVRLEGSENMVETWQAFGAPRGVVEKLIDFRCELSVVCARSQDGKFVHFPVGENIHRNQILDYTIAPARVSEEIAAEAAAVARTVAEALDYVGTLAVEMFLTTDNEILVNEIAPRPHNSGHHTIDACMTSQFGQQLRAVAGIPLGETRQHSPAVMVNILGDIWPEEGGDPDWSPILSHPTAKLHLYGKRSAKPGRKMGHFTVLGESIESALAHAMQLRAALGIDR
jgi:5-(carboxyamino)imidazole ribonucleotide synthase